ncbi:MAG: DNA ligase (NAD(+)) LigA [Phycisphaerae bacterium]|nr:DNA ligase (NAD(+)) LigA [Phycisphaerae bacterium]
MSEFDDQTPLLPLARIEELRALLHRANRFYYVEADPIMSDTEFDRLLAELARLEEAHPEAHDPDSPTSRVGGEPVSGFETVSHARRMMSIDNTYSMEDVRAWHERVVKALGDDAPVYVCEPKIDGVAINLRFDQGRLVAAVTRGDGEQGDLVTSNVRAMESVPLVLAEDPPAVLEVRGEIYMPDASFERVNADRETRGEQLFANARNSTAGTLKSLDPAVVRARGLRFCAHGRGEVVGLEDVPTYSEFVGRIRAFGLAVSNRTMVCTTIDEVLQCIETFGAERGEVGFATDGMVVRVDSFAAQDTLGETAKAPRWCIAFKYPAEQAVTRLLKVDWQVGKGGTLTPRATMEPVFVAGTTVKHATMHNIEEIRRKDIRLGDRVVIEKAGEIIPQIVEPVVAERTGDEQPIEPPATCLECAGVVEQEGPKLYCTNPECAGQFRERLKWFVGRGQMDIDGFGEKLVDQLLDAGLVSHFADLFRLNRDDLLALERMGETSADNLLAALDEARGRGLARVLAGLGIRHIGTSASKILAGAFADADALLAAEEVELEALPDFGAITAKALHDYLASDSARSTFSLLAEVGVSLESERGGVVDESSVFSGQVVVITGTLEGFKRSELSERLETLGAKVTGSVSAKTTLLIAGEKAGSKRAKAESLGVEIWDEPRLLEELSRLQG